MVLYLHIKTVLLIGLRLDCRFDVCFPMIKWEGNEEIWSIKDLKKLEVVEEYEENSGNEYLNGEFHGADGGSC